MVAPEVMKTFRCCLKKTLSLFLDSGPSLQPHPTRGPSSMLMERSGVEGELLLLLPNRIGGSLVL